MFNFTVQVTDSSAPAQTDTKALSITVTTDPLTITTTALNNGRRNRAYSQTLQATGGTTPYSRSIVVGALPPGLTLNASTGTISGTPTTAGTFKFTVQVADDSSPTKTATKALSIKIRN